MVFSNKILWHGKEKIGMDRIGWDLNLRYNNLVMLKFKKWKFNSLIPHNNLMCSLFRGREKWKKIELFKIDKTLCYMQNQSLPQLLWLYGKCHKKGNTFSAHVSIIRSKIIKKRKKWGYILRESCGPRGNYIKKVLNWVGNLIFCKTTCVLGGGVPKKCFTPKQRLEKKIYNSCTKECYKQEKHFIISLM